MAITNPIDRKRKTSFLLGMVVMGVITILIAAGLAMLLMDTRKKLKEEENKKIDIQGVLQVAKKATEEITVGDLKKSKVIKGEATERVRSDIYIPDGDKKAYAKIDLPAGTIVTKDMVYVPENEDESKINNTLRLYDIVGLSLPANLKEGDVVDIRFVHPNLPDFVVLAKKKVERADTDTIWVKLKESEIILLSSATIESYLIKGSKMYVTIYTDPGVQEPSKITYPINSNLIGFLKEAISDPENDNIYEQVSNQAGRTFFGENYGLQSAEEAISAIQTGVNKDKSARERKRADFIQNELNDSK